jgi:hypothetical protein
MNKSTYIVKFVFQIHTNSNAAQFDEQWRVILGDSEAEVIKKAKIIGVTEQEAFMQKDGSEIRWEFVSITDIIPFDNAQDGHFIFSRTEEPEHPDHYLRSVQLKSKHHETITLASQA